jgi:hypothetical protein
MMMLVQVQVQAQCNAVINNFISSDINTSLSCSTVYITAALYNSLNDKKNYIIAVSYTFQTLSLPSALPVAKCSPSLLKA